MYRKPKAYAGPKLPQTLLDKVEGATNGARDRRPRKGRESLPLSRKAQRKSERDHKKFKGHDGSQKKRTWQPVADEDSAASEDDDGPADRDIQSNEKSLRSTVKQPQGETDLAQYPHRDDAPTRSHISNKTKERLDADDAEIVALEKKLGLKHKKLSKAFQDDGLDDLVEGLDEGSTDGERSLKRARESDDDKWIASKRMRQTNLSKDDFDPPSEDSTDVESEQLDYDQNEASLTDEISDAEDHQLSSKSEDHKRVKENPYVAPLTADMQATTKYVPPSRRAPPSDDAELNQRLKRQTQGLLNRLSESNLMSIVNETDKLYQSNPRQFVTSTLVDLLLTLICDRTALNDTFIILHAGFVSAMYRLLGPDFGAPILEGIVNKIDHFYYTLMDNLTSTGKEVSNLITLLSQLFSFQVLSCDIVFDYIRIFLSSLTENHAELLLRIVRTSGQQLRQEDPSSLKDIVALMQDTVAATPSDQVSVRTQFLIETITDLKNNRLKAGVAGSTVALEHSNRMRKILGSLNSKGVVRGSEPLRISLQDVRDSDKRGKWWLIGASWKGKDDINATAKHVATPNKPSNSDASDLEDLVAGTTAQDLPSLAHQNSMNNPLRRSIFSAVMTASDYRDAQTRLQKLHLSRAQEREIPRVLLHCAGAEKAYNPYYALVARQLCAADRKLRVAFQFALWDFLKRIGGAADGRDDDDDDVVHPVSLQLHTIVNYAKLYGSLIASGALSILVLKTMDPVALLALQKLRSSSRSSASGAHSGRASTFLEVLLIAIFASSSKPQVSTAPPGKRRTLDIDAAETKPRKMDLIAVFRPALGLPSLALGLREFARRVVRPSDLLSAGKERKRVRRACEVVADLLEGATLDAGGEGEEEDEDLLDSERGEDQALDIDWDEDD